MHCLVYNSSSLLPLKQEELSDILQKSRSKNEQLGITGMLLYSEGNIIQLLEGEKEMVQQVFTKIENDWRHRNIIKLADGMAEYRLFPQWSMGFKALSARDFSDIAGFINLDNPGWFIPGLQIKDEELITMLTSFVQNTQIPV